MIDKPSQKKFEGRKRDHIKHALEPRHQATGLSALDSIRLIHEALPDFDFEEIHLETNCLGLRLPTPFYMAGMTAGHRDAPKINLILAKACAERGWAMGVGSQRGQLANPGIDDWATLRKKCPDLTLFGNIGIAQLIETPVAKIRELLESIQARALVVHLNPLQEVLQPEGTPQFRGAFSALAEIIREVELPVVLKETGCGFSRPTLERLSQLSPSLAAIDVSGLGGTHWGRIEGTRAKEESLCAKASETFANWGEPTVYSVLNGCEIFPPLESSTEVWASGGVRSGLDAAKLIALGAQRVGYAKPALEAALHSADNLRIWMEQQEFELKVALFCTGHRTPELLRERGQKEEVWNSI